MAEPVEMQLGTLCDGAVANQFQAALDEVARNMRDPNFDADAKREITIKVVFAPDSAMKHVAVSGHVAVKMPGRAAAYTLAYPQTKPGQFGFIERAPAEQLVLDEVHKLQPQVVNGGKA